MATLSTKLAAFGLFVISLSGSAMADTYHHIDEVALAISQQTKELVCETRHYRHTPEYGHLVSDTREIARLADHIHELAHHHGSLAHLEADLNQLDTTFHHLESVFDRVEQAASWGHGHVHGNTLHVKRLLNAIEDNIHHLQNDIRSLCAALRPAPIVHRYPFSGAGGWDRHDAHYGGGGWDRHDGHHGGWGPRPRRARTFSIGGGSSRFTFRF